MELLYAYNKILAGDPSESILLDGNDPDMLQAGHSTRLRIVEWYRRRLQEPVPQFGNYVEGPNARPWVRADLLAAEMVRHGKDIPEEGPQREAIALEYLLHMSKQSTWGSTPEYSAAACMTKKTINVWQRNSEGIFIINTVNGSFKEEDNNKCYNLFFSNNHYQAMMTGEQHAILTQQYGQFKNIIPLFEPKDQGSRGLSPLSAASSQEQAAVLQDM